MFIEAIAGALLDICLLINYPIACVHDNLFWKMRLHTFSVLLHLVKWSRIDGSLTCSTVGFGAQSAVQPAPSMNPVGFGSSPFNTSAGFGTSPFVTPAATPQSSTPAIIPQPSAPAVSTPATFNTWVVPYPTNYASKFVFVFFSNIKLFLTM